MILDIPGVRVGHWTDPEAETGCTVVLFPEGTVASGEVRGGAPATRDFALLEPGRVVDRLDAVVMSGGSAFGLAACSAVMTALEAEGVGFTTSGGVVPIVVGMSIYDLAVGDGSVRPGPDEGAAAVAAATAGPVELGRVGAGAGATIGKWRGQEHSRPGAFVGATSRSGDLVVAALIAVNASGDIDDGTTHAAVAGGTFVMPEIVPFENTTIGVVITNAVLSKLECHLVSQSAHGGFARAIVPAHTQGDGDAVVTAATGGVDADVAAVRILATEVVERAIRSISVDRQR